MNDIDLTEAIKAAHKALAARWMTGALMLAEDKDYPQILTDVLHAALPAIREQLSQPEVVEPVDLQYLSERARAYVLGLEAKLKERREKIERLTAKLNSPGHLDEIVERKIQDAYTQGWREASNHIASQTDDLRRTLTGVRGAAIHAYSESYRQEGFDD